MARDGPEVLDRGGRQAGRTRVGEGRAPVGAPVEDAPEKAYRCEARTRSDRIFAPAGSPSTGVQVSPRSVLYTGVTSVSLGDQ
nr:hypothetical protein GCM10025732_31280 [Glycomyces mayteni]